MTKTTDFGMISIVVPVYNAERFIKRCIESILSQKYTNIELILVDDGSEDKSYELCKSYAETDPRVSLFKQRNQGVSIARNTGINNSKGDYIGFIDSDDCISSYMFGNLLITLKKYDADMVDSKLQTFYDKRALRYYKKKYDKLEIEVNEKVINDRREMFSSFYSMKNFQWSVSTKLFKKSSIGEVRFEGNNGEDTKFLLNFIEQNAIFISLTNNYYYYYKRNLESSTQDFSIKSLDILDYYKLFAQYLKQYEEEELYLECMAKYYVLMLNYYSRLKFSRPQDVEKKIFLNLYYKEINQNINIIMKNNYVSLVHKTSFFYLVKVLN